MYIPASGIECDQGSDWSCIKRASGIECDQGSDWSCIYVLVVSNVTRAVIGHVYAC